MIATPSRLAGAGLQLFRWSILWRMGLLLLALLFPFLVRSYYLSLGIEVLVFAIFAMSLNLLLGYTGLVSFGHAAFFGLGSYILAYTAIHLSSNLLVTLPLVVLGSALAALLIGLLALRTSGIYFLMITLAFAQMLYSVAIRWSAVTGGSDGLSGIPRATIGIEMLGYTFDSRTSAYYLVLLCFLFSFWFMRHLIESPFGWTLRGIRENEQRMRALGYNTFYYKLVIFVLASVFAAVAGMLLSLTFWSAPPERLYWTTSGMVMIMLIVGGPGTTAGPVVGAAVIQLLSHFVSSMTKNWQTVMGILFMLFVLLAPQGIMGLVRDYLKRREERNHAAS